MSECRHGQPDWTVCQECIDDVNQNQADRIKQLEAVARKQKEAWDQHMEVAQGNAWEIVKLEREVEAAQAKIDALMLEYCPDEMTEDQVANWERHQVPATDGEMDELARALEP
jgi:hypothetical protein